MTLSSSVIALAPPPAVIQAAVSFPSETHVAEHTCVLLLSKLYLCSIHTVVNQQCKIIFSPKPLGVGESASRVSALRLYPHALKMQHNNQTECTAVVSDQPVDMRAIFFVVHLTLRNACQLLRFARASSQLTGWRTRLLIIL